MLAPTALLRRFQRRYAEPLAQLEQFLAQQGQARCWQQGLSHAELQAQYTALAERYPDWATRLRVLRNIVVAWLVQHDACMRHMELWAVTRTLTHLAELSLRLCQHHVLADLRLQYGDALLPEGEPCQLWCLGMGKLGARELNASSDVDLIYVYDAEGHTAGISDGQGVHKRISNSEYFARAVRAISLAMADNTEHGFVFRVDLALRPNGNSGPPAISFAALEQYFLVQGREWERFAWMKSRIVAPASAGQFARAQQLRQLVLPFVFRKYLDYAVFDSLRDLQRQIRQHAQQRSTHADDVKLGPGGIRQIEFIVQLLQVVRGGQFPELRTRATLDALPRLVHAHQMSAAAADQLAAAYCFFRHVEHRVQYLDDQQTHALPHATRHSADLAWVAASMGFSQLGDFQLALQHHRAVVNAEFDALLGASPSATAPGPAAPNPASHTANAVAATAAVASRPGAAAERTWLGAPVPADWPKAFVQVLAERSTAGSLQALRPQGRQRLWRLCELTAQLMQAGLCDASAAQRWLDWIIALGRRENYLSLLLERPAVHQRMLTLLGTARFAQRFLLQHPSTIDELSSTTLAQERFHARAFEEQLERRRLALAQTREDDDEALLNVLRRAHHAQTLRTLVRDIEGHLSVEAVADDLSALADTILRVTARWCWQRLRQRHCATPQFAIIGYGKLGGKELGYGSDLDIVFVYDDAAENAGEIYAAYARKLIHWLSVKTSDGDLYEIDTELRPNGNSGLLVSRWATYVNYQQQQGSNTAWAWELQAITRARFVLGSAALAQAFEQLRIKVITTARDPVTVRADICAMRERVRQAAAVPTTEFDAKHSPGGMMDAEFVVQFLVLAYSHAHPELQANKGNIALLQRAQDVGLIPAPLGTSAAQAYREQRQMQHLARLDESKARYPLAQCRALQQPILRLWQQVMLAELTQ